MDQHHIFVQTWTFQLIGLLVNDKALLSFALALCSCFWKGVACDELKEETMMESQMEYVSESQAI